MVPDFKDPSSNDLYQHSRSFVFTRFRGPNAKA
jgi:hypothetical protein